MAIRKLGVMKQLIKSEQDKHSEEELKEATKIPFF